MNANALMVAGWVILLAGVIIRIVGDRSTGTEVLLGAVVVLIASRAVGEIGRR
jgi:hypothetical protein